MNPFFRSISRILLAGLMTLLAVMVRGQQLQPDETLPGFKANDVLFSGEYDHVSAYSGDTGISIPLGPSYPLGKGFNFQLKAFNTLKYWYFQDGTSCEMQNGYGTKWVTRGYVGGFPTIGAGWTLSPGYVGADTDGPYTYVYVSPDGGHHPAGSDGKTVDGSRLQISCTGNPWTSCTVTFPDGAQHYFNHGLPDPAPISGTSPDFTIGGLGNVLGLYQVKDAWSRVMMNVAYDATTPWEVSNIYLGPNSNPGTPVIAFSWTTKTVNGVQWAALDHLTFPAINGSSAQTIYFAYQISGQGPIRTQGDTSLPGADFCPCTTDTQDPANAAVHLLTSVTVKNGTTTQAAQFLMGYDGYGHITSFTLPTGGQITYQLGVAQHAFGNDEQTNWPVKTLEYSDNGWTQGDEPTAPEIPGCDPPPTHLFIRDTLGNATAVKTRTYTDSVRSLTSTTNYYRVDMVPQTYPETNPGQGWNTRIVEVVEPLDDSSSKLTRYLFHVPNANQNDPSTSGLEIEHAIFTGATFTDNETPIRTVINCVDQMNTAGFCGYVTSDNVTVNAFPSGSQDFEHSAGQVTWYGAKPTASLADHSGGTCPDSNNPATPCVSEMFSNSLGHTWTGNGLQYNIKTTRSDNIKDGLGTPVDLNRSETTAWAPCLTPWLPDIFTQRVIQETGAQSPSSITSDYTFESCRPFIQTITTNGGSSYGVLRYTATDDAVNKGAPSAIERKGTSGNISTTALTHNYTSNANTQILTDKWYPLTPTWNVFDVDRDANTALITTSRDANSLATGYTYDGLGRLTVVKPPPQTDSTNAFTNYCYLLNSDGNAGNLNPYGLNFVYVKRGPSGGVCASNESSSTLTWEAYQYDGAGRVIREFRLMPNDLGNGSNFAIRDTYYDKAGNRKSLSEWTPCMPSGSGARNIGYCALDIPGGNTQLLTGGTVYSSFDVFGRPQKITRADGTFTYIDRGDSPTIPGSPCSSAPPYSGGAASYTDYAEITTACTSTSSIAAGPTTSRSDGLGRLVSVTEPSVGSGTDTTTYDYNALGKVALVTQGTQTRTFVYDGNGFLRSETHPENGTTTYSTYDAIGDVLSKTEGSGGTQVVSTLAYDSAGRLTQLSTDEGGGRTYVQNTYDSNTLASPPSPNYPLGKLTRRIGLNYPFGQAASVQEDLGYGGSSNPEGRLSKRVTAVGSDSDTLDGTGVRDGESVAATDSWTYNSMGLAATYNHPRLSGTYQEAFTYGAGLPTSETMNGTTDFSAVNYSQAGALWKWTDGGSLVTTIAPNTIPSRPASITNVATSFSYDGAGNITGMGSDTFKYDVRGRLTSAKYSGQSTTCTDGGSSMSQCFAYDKFGNLLSKSGINAQTYCSGSCTNNQVTGQSYDTRGNMTAVGGFDAINRNVSGAGWHYLYNGAGERVAKYNSNNSVLRREMAKLIGQARGDTPSAASGCTGTNCNGGTHDPYFTDVACIDPDRPWIDDLKGKGIVAGCTSSTYCPENTVNRGQMAVYIAAGLLWPSSIPTSGYVGTFYYNCVSGPSGASYFDDVLPTNAFCPAVNYIASQNITAGCGTDPYPPYGPIYCPSNAVIESQMVLFLHAAWPNFLYVPRGTIYTFRNEGDRLATEMTSTAGSVSCPGTPDFPVATTVTRDNAFLGNLLVASYDSSALGGTVGWTYYHSDHLGTPRYITGVEGPFSPKYWPYGEEVSQNTTSQKLRFATMERDIETNRFFDHARSHDFNFGRFVALDKLGGRAEDPLSWNRYRYARDNPIKLEDQNGLGENCPTCGRKEQADSAVVAEMTRLRAMDSQGLGHPDEELLKAAVLAGEGAYAMEAGVGVTMLFGTSAGLAAASSPNDPGSAAAIAGGVSLALGPLARTGPEGVLGPVFAGAGSAAQQKFTSGTISPAQTALTAATAFLTLGINLGTQPGETGRAVVNVLGKGLTFGLSLLSGVTQVTKPKPPPPPPPCKQGTPGCPPLPFGTG